MNWSDYEAVWKRQEPPAGADADLSDLRETFATKSQKLSRRLFWRDIREAAAGLVVAGFFVSFEWRGGKAYWPVGFAVLLILGLTAFFFLERIRARRERLGPDAPLLAKLEADMAELRRQRRLLLHVASWYLAPCFAAILIVVATIYANLPVPVRQKSHVFLGCYLVSVVLIYWGVWALNRQAVRKKIEPRLLELERLRADLLSPQ